jgi:hypothetical protein
LGFGLIAALPNTLGGQFLLRRRSMSPDLLSRNGNSHGFQMIAMDAPDKYSLRRQLIANVNRSKLSANDNFLCDSKQVPGGVEGWRAILESPI